MDEILASIRRIVSEEEAPVSHAPTYGEAPATAHIQGLADRLAPAETAKVEPAAAPAATPPAAPPLHANEALVGQASASATASSFDALKTAAGDAARERSSMVLPAPGRSLEDVTRELLAPLLKAWLDEHLPAIVQDRVDEEVTRIARGRVR
jgi:cell pole-organizing protein PopZ